MTPAPNSPGTASQNPGDWGGAVLAAGRHQGPSDRNLGRQRGSGSIGPAAGRYSLLKGNESRWARPVRYPVAYQSNWNPYTSRNRKMAANNPTTGNTITNVVALAWPIAANKDGNRKIPMNTATLLKT
jgi:hypothetical protein